MPMQFHRLSGAQPDYLAALGALIALALLGYGAAHFMDAHGHYVTGMNNQVVWGVPHVFALGLILAASGALNVASLSSVFGVVAQRPLARLSALLAIALLLGGVLVLVLDLGRPERLIVALTHYNFKSVFAWNIPLYTGFVAVALVYLYLLFEPRFNTAANSRGAGLLALGWRIALTTGSGAIFAVVVARPLYDAAILVPLFIALSLALGGAAFLLLSGALSRWHGDCLGARASRQQSRLLGWFVAAALFLTAVFHLTNLYAPEGRAASRFILLHGGLYTALFWGAVVGGGVVPLMLLFAPRAGRWRISAAALVLAGGFAQLYVIIIGGQVLPLVIFPGKRASSLFYDGEVAVYSPALPEWLLGLGGVAVALLILLLTLRVLPFLPPHQLTNSEEVQ